MVEDIGLYMTSMVDEVVVGSSSRSVCVVAVVGYKDMQW